MSTTPLLSHQYVFPGPTLLWRCGAAMAAAGMIASAFGTHGLKHRQGMTTDGVHAWETACHYAIYNGLALLLISLHPRLSLQKLAGPAIAIGGLVFSGTIMAMAWNHNRFKALGPVTPLGGSVMIAGYVALAM